MMPHFLCCKAQTPVAAPVAPAAAAAAPASAKGPDAASAPDVAAVAVDAVADAAGAGDGLPQHWTANTRALYAYLVASTTTAPADELVRRCAAFFRGRRPTYVSPPKSLTPTNRPCSCSPARTRAALRRTTCPTTSWTFSRYWIK